MAKAKVINNDTAKAREILAYFGKGMSAYEIAVKNGFKGTEQEWLDSIRPILNASQFNSLKPLAGKKILCLGDSIMGNDQVNGVPSYLAEYSGATVYNGGFGGSCFCVRTTGSVNACFDLPNLLSAKLNGDWTTQETQAETLRKTGTFYYFPDTLEMLKGLDFSELDIITLAYGTNDWRNGETLEYMITALKEAIDTIQLNWPEIRILVITPIWRYFGTGTSSGDDETRFGEGYTLKEWTKHIEQAAKDKRISVLNAYENMPLSINNASTYFDTDTTTEDGLDHTHLNEKGNQMYAQIICGKLCGLFASPGPDSYDGSGESLEIDETLKFNEYGQLGVKTATEVEKDNTLPITSAAVHATVGNIEILLATI